jgi:alpha-D-ribose 1-methylphosphonate 5-triphosphate synthase subunit PhnL
VIALIREAVERGAALVGIFHDAHVGAAVATRRVNVGDFRGTAA